MNASSSPSAVHPGPPSASLDEIAAAVPDWESRLLRGTAARDALSQLTLGMAHELNNLVGGISALSEIYLQGLESGLALKDGLKLIHNSAGRLQILLRELTGINRASQGAKEYVNLVETIRGEATLFHHVLPKSMRLETVLPEQEVAALIDETALRLLLLNLVLVLRDMLGRERGTGTVKIALARVAGTDALAELTLSAAPVEGQKIPPAPGMGDPAWFEARVRLLDAYRAAPELGGQFEMRGETMVLTLPLIG